MDKLAADVAEWRKTKELSKPSIKNVSKRIVAYFLVPVQLFLGLLGLTIAGMAINGMAANGGSRPQPEYGDNVILVYLAAYFFSILGVIYALVIRQKPQQLAWWQIGCLAILPSVVWAAGLVFLSLMGLNIG